MIKKILIFVPLVWQLAYAGQPLEYAAQLRALKDTHLADLDKSIENNKNKLDQILEQCKEHKAKCNTQLSQELMIKNAMMRTQKQRMVDALEPAINFLEKFPHITSNHYMLEYANNFNLKDFECF